MSTVTEPVILDKTGKEIAAELNGIRTLLARGSHVLYGFHIDGSESDPAAKVTYLEDAVGMTPAYMDYANSKFNYGSWAGAFFMPRPCMVRQTGGVDYYLDPDDYTKKEDGTASDISDTSYAGNAMMEWGQNGKKIWYKVVPDDGDETSASVYISDERLDPDYHAWSFISNQCVEVDHFYTPIYNGSVVDSVMRSMSGLAVTQSLAGGATGEINAAKGNNKDSNVCWFIEVLADRILINFLLILMGKSTDTQTVFGRGLDSGSQAALTAYRTGALDASGMFFGYSDGSHGVKVFGMENYWAAQWRRHAGFVKVGAAEKIKLTYGQQDGSTVDGYNTDGSGYIDIGVTPDGSSGGYISEMAFNEYGAFPKTMSGSATTHFCDACWFNNGATTYALFGGCSDHGLRCGAFASGLSSGAGAVTWYCGAAVSYKPLA